MNAAAALTEMFAAVAGISWRMAWLIFLVAALRILVRGRIPAQVWFAAWIVVAVRLLLPFSLASAWSPYNLAVPARNPLPAATSAPLPVPLLARTESPETPIVMSSTSSTMPTNPPAEPANELTEGPPVAIPAHTPPDAWSVAARLWLAGVIAMLLARGWGAVRFRAELRHSMPVQDRRLRAIVTHEAAAYRISSTLCLETPAVDAPALYGWLRPRLLFPLGFVPQFTEDELRLVVRHELAHWRRRDLFAQSLMQAALALHWFNPLVWWAARLAGADCELACDESVLQQEATPQAYGSTLLKVLGLVRVRRRPCPVVAMIEGRQQLAQRVRLIAGYRTWNFGRMASGALLVGIIAAASITRESQATPSADRDAPSASPASLASAPPPGNPAPTYVLQPLDLIRVQIYQQPDLSRECRISADGKVQLPRIGPVDFRGRTVAEAEKIVRNLYQNQIDDPRVSIAVLEYSPSTPALPPSGVIRFPAADVKLPDEPPKHGGDPRRANDGGDAARVLQDQIEQQQKRVDELARDLQAFKEQNRLPSLDQRRDVVTDALRRADQELRRSEQGWVGLDMKLKQVAEYRAKRADLTTLPYVASQPLVVSLKQRALQQRIDLSMLGQRYGEKHPEMIRATRELEATEKELARAVETVCGQLQAEYEAASRSVDTARKELAVRTEDALELDRLAVTYRNKERDLRTQEQEVNNLVERRMEIAAARPVSSTGAGSAPLGGFSVSVVGAVNQQGAFNFMTDDAPIVLDVIARAGGFSSRADRNAIRLMRVNAEGTRATELLTEEMLMTPRGAAALLRRGDVVVVPELPPENEAKRVTILGAVVNPGAFIYPASAGEVMTLVELLAKAGGATRIANLKAVRILRADQKGAMTALTTDVASFLNGGGENFTLRPGDIVMVSERVL